MDFTATGAAGPIALGLCLYGLGSLLIDLARVFGG